MSAVIWVQVLLFSLGVGTGIGGSWLWRQQNGRRDRQGIHAESQTRSQDSSRVRSGESAPRQAPNPSRGLSPNPSLRPSPSRSPGSQSASHATLPNLLGAPLADPAVLATDAAYPEHSAILGTNVSDLTWANYYAGFLARTSHELRSPLSSMMSLHQIVLNDLCDDAKEERQCIEQAYNAAQGLLEMLELMTQLSKLEVGKHPRHVQTTPLFHIVQDVQMLMRLQAANRNFRLTVDLPEPTLLVQAAPGCLRQGLLCLINSILEDDESRQAHLTYCCDRSQGHVDLVLEDDRSPETWSALQAQLDTVHSQIPQFQDPDPSAVTLANLEALLDQVRQTSDLPLPQLSTDTQLCLAQGFLQLAHSDLQFISASTAEGSGAFRCRLALGPEA